MIAPKPSDLLASLLEKAYRLLGGRARFHVIFDGGHRTRAGFISRLAAERWARENFRPKDFVVWEQGSIDLRILPEEPRA